MLVVTDILMMDPLTNVKIVWKDVRNVITVLNVLLALFLGYPHHNVNALMEHFSILVLTHVTTVNFPVLTVRPIVFVHLVLVVVHNV